MTDGERLEKLRQDLGLPLEVFALVLGIEPSAFYKWETDSVRFHRRKKTGRFRQPGSLHPLDILANLLRLREEELERRGVAAKILFDGGRNKARKIFELPDDAVPSNLVGSAHDV